MAGYMDIDFTRRNKKPRMLSESEKDKLDEFIDAIHYSARCVVSPLVRVAPLLKRLQVLRRRVRIPPRAAPEADAEGNTQGLLRRHEGHAQAAVGGGVESARHHPGMVARRQHRRMLTGMQSLGWEHYEVHEPEPHILLFK